MSRSFIKVAKSKAEFQKLQNKPNLSNIMDVNFATKIK